MPKHTSIYGKLAVIFVVLFAGGNYYGANIYEHYLGEDIEKYILYSTALLAIIFGVLYAAGKNKYERSLVNISGRLYTPETSQYVTQNSISPSTIESAIQNGSRTDRGNSIKYKWTENSIGNIIVITNKDNVVIGVSC